MVYQHLPSGEAKLLVNFFHSTTGSILSYCMTVWYASCTTVERKDQHHVVKMAQKIIRNNLPNLDSL